VRIQRGGGLAQPEVNLCLLIKRQITQQHVRVAHRSLKVALGERWPFIRALWFFANERNSSVEPLAAESLGCAGTGDASTDDDDGPDGEVLIHSHTAFASDASRVAAPPLP